MSIPYLPGWWDEISKNATGLAQQLPQFIQPDRVANKKLQEMVQQNPMILEQMGNMDAGTRSLLEQSLGFRKHAPISQLPVGAERQMREMNMGLLNETLASPEGKQDYLKKTLGRRTATDLKKEQQELAQGAQALDLNAMNIELTSGKVKDYKRTQAAIDAAMQKYPDLQGINYKVLVRDMIRTGKPIDPAMITASMQDEGAKTLFEVAVKSELMSLENEYSMRLRTAKDPNTSALLLRTLTEQANQIETTQQRLFAQKQLAEKSLENNIAYRTGMMSKDPVRKAEAQKIYDATVGGIDKALQTYMQAGIDIQKRTEKYGELIGLPKVEEATTTKDSPAEIERKRKLRELAGLP